MTDSGPLECALRELGEETRLPGDALRLVSSGPVQKIHHINTGNTFNVHPFLFELTNYPALRAVKTDWEHQSSQWIPVNEVIHFIRTTKAVPNLLLTWLRVYDPLKLREMIRDIKDDTVNGAAVLATKAVLALKHACATENLDELFGSDEAQKLERMEGGGSDSIDIGVEFRNYIGSLVWRIGRLRPPMAAPIVSNMLAVVEMACLSAGSCLTPKGIRKSARQWLEQQDGSHDSVAQNLLKAIASVPSRGCGDKIAPGSDGVDTHIFTLSYSSTVMRGLVRVLGEPDVAKVAGLVITAAESRPGNEGARLIGDLAQDYHDTTGRCRFEVIGDAAVLQRMGSVVRDVAGPKRVVVVVGADYVDPESGQFINKIGTACMLMAARLFSLPVLVVTQMCKVMPWSQLGQILCPSPTPAPARGQGEDTFGSGDDDDNAASVATEPPGPDGSASKDLDPHMVMVEPNHDPREVFGAYSKQLRTMFEQEKIHTINQYFETVPASVVHSADVLFVTEEDCFGIKELCDRQRQLYPNAVRMVKDLTAWQDL